MFPSRSCLHLWCIPLHMKSKVERRTIARPTRLRNGHCNPAFARIGNCASRQKDPTATGELSLRSSHRRRGKQRDERHGRREQSLDAIIHEQSPCRAATRGPPRPAQHLRQLPCLDDSMRRQQLLGACLGRFYQRKVSCFHFDGVRHNTRIPEKG